jgi:hypothetical protein
MINNSKLVFHFPLSIPRLPKSFLSFGSGVLNESVNYYYYYYCYTDRPLGHPVHLYAFYLPARLLLRPSSLDSLIPTGKRQFHYGAWQHALSYRALNSICNSSFPQDRRPRQYEKHALITASCYTIYAIHPLSWSSAVRGFHSPSWIKRLSNIMRQVSFEPLQWNSPTIDI